MMNRRMFLRLTGFVAVAGAIEPWPVSAEQDFGATLAKPPLDPELASALADRPLTIPEPGTYRISCRVRLEDSLVQISGAGDAQSISWSTVDGLEHPVTAFTTFQHFDRAGMTPTIRVRGGRLEEVTVAPVDIE